MVLELKGDIRETSIYTIAHGVNCQGVMGSGVAKALFQKWPNIKDDYIKYHKRTRESMGDCPDYFLGKNHYVETYNTKKIKYPGKLVINMHTQLDYGRDGKQYVDYSAVLNCFIKISNGIEVLAVPRIGAGLAGGDWGIIKNIMVETTQKKGIDLVIYTLEK